MMCTSESDFIGDDMNEWIDHYRLQFAKPIFEEMGAKSLDDVRHLCSMDDLVERFQNSAKVLEFSRFKSAVLSSTFFVGSHISSIISGKSGCLPTLNEDVIALLAKARVSDFSDKLIKLLEASAIYSLEDVRRIAMTQSEDMKSMMKPLELKRFLRELEESKHDYKSLDTEVSVDRKDSKPTGLGSPIGFGSPAAGPDIPLVVMAEASKTADGRPQWNCTYCKFENPGYEAKCVGCKQEKYDEIDASLVDPMPLKVTASPLLKDLEVSKKADIFVERVSAVAVFGDSEYIAIASLAANNEPTISLWNPTTGKSTSTHPQALVGHSGRVSTLRCLTGSYMASGGSDSKIIVWNSTSRTIERTLEGHKIGCAITDLELLPNNALVSTAEDGVVKTWDPSSGFCLQSIDIMSVDAAAFGSTSDADAKKATTGPGWTCTFCAHSNELSTAKCASCKQEKYVETTRIDKDNWTCRYCSMAHDDATRNPSRQCSVCGQTNGPPAPSRRTPHSFLSGMGSLYPPGGDIVGSRKADKKATGAKSRSPPIFASTSLSDDPMKAYFDRPAKGQWRLLHISGDLICCWSSDVASKSRVHSKYSPHDGLARERSPSMAPFLVPTEGPLDPFVSRSSPSHDPFGPPPPTPAYGYSPGAYASAHPATMDGYGGGGYSRGLSRDSPSRRSEKSIFNSIMVIDTSKGKVTFVLAGHSAPITDVKLLRNSFHKGSAILATASADGAIKLWNPETGKRLRTLGDPRSRDDDRAAVTALCETKKHELASGSADGNVVIWNVDSGESRELNHRSGDHVTALSMLQNDCLAVWFGSGLIKIWNIDSGAVKQMSAMVPVTKLLTLSTGSLVGWVESWGSHNDRSASSRDGRALHSFVKAERPRSAGGAVDKYMFSGVEYGGPRDASRSVAVAGVVVWHQ